MSHGKSGTIGALLAIALADGKVNTHEKMLLAAFCARYGVSSDELKHIIENPTEFVENLPESREGRIGLVRKMAMMSAADGNVADAEAEVAAMIAMAMGMSVAEVRQAFSGS